MTISTDPWEQLHHKIAPALVAEAEYLAQEDPGFEPVCFILGSDAAGEKPFREVLEALDAEGEFKPGQTASITLPRKFAVMLLQVLGAPQAWAFDAAGPLPVLPVITCTHGELRLRRERYAVPDRLPPAPSPNE